MPSRFLVFAALTVTFFFLGCVIPQPPGEKAISVPFTVLSDGSFSGIAEEGYFYITNEENWKAFVEKYSFPERIDLVSSVDFSKENVIVLAMGQKPSPGYSINVTKMEWKNKCAPGQTCPAVEPHVQITAETKSPEPGVPVLAVISTPFQIVKINKNDVSLGTAITFVVDGVSKNQTPFSAGDSTDFTRVYRNAGGGITGAYSRLTLNMSDGQWVVEAQTSTISHPFIVTLDEEQTQKLEQALRQVDLTHFPGVSEPPCCDIITTYIEIDRGGETYGFRIQSIEPVTIVSADVQALLVILDEIQNEVLVAGE